MDRNKLAHDMVFGAVDNTEIVRKVISLCDEYEEDLRRRMRVIDILEATIKLLQANIALLESKSRRGE